MLHSDKGIKLREQTSLNKAVVILLYLWFEKASGWIMSRACWKLRFQKDLVHTRTLSQRFQIYLLSPAFSKSSVLGDKY